MPNKEILLTVQPTIRDVVHERLEHRLSEAGYAFRAIYSEEPLSEPELKKAIAGAAGYIVSLEAVTAEVMRAAADLKAVSKFGVGTDNIDLVAAESMGIEISNCPGSNANAVAELTIGLMISVARNVHHRCTEMRKGNWIVEVGSEISEKRIGVVGFGNIGKRVAKYLTAFNADIMAYDMYRDENAADALGVRYAALEEIFASCDVVTVHLPLTDRTYHLVDAPLLESMKHGAFVINLARGGVVDENALFEAVRNGPVGRAAVDVFETEPPTRSKLLKDDRFVVTPHIGASTTEATINMAEMSVDNVLSVIETGRNPNPVRRLV